MPSVPILRPREVVKAFEKLDWEIARGKLRSLIARAGLSVEEFIAAL